MEASYHPSVSLAGRLEGDYLAATQEPPTHPPPVAAGGQQQRWKKALSVTPTTPSPSVFRHPSTRVYAALGAPTSGDGVCASLAYPASDPAVVLANLVHGDGILSG
jgi:hypothetical protein